MISPDAQTARVHQTTASMQRRMRALDALLEEQIRTLEFERHFYEPQGLAISRRNARFAILVIALAAMLAFSSGFIAGSNRVF
jgi:hypothetical protein